MKILMATMSMGVGGAETHILELSRELRRRGHDVFVASNGGVYAESLAESGVKHIKVPLHSKNPVCVAESIALLSALMEKEKFDIVHAHARIPAFICGILQKKYGFPFMTTAHFDFRTDALLSRITDWGDRALAVSEDIADNMVVKFGYPREKITLVKNGIDTERFSPDTDGSFVRSKFGLCGKKVVMYLGRLDEDSYLPAKVLLESITPIASACGDVCALIVGGGEKYGMLKDMASKINAEAGRELVILAGATSEPEKYIAACDVFVGPSRSAMESLASKKPTVIAGTFGMLGEFSPEIEGEALRTNFCCRGSEPSTAERVTECVIRLLGISEAERKVLSDYGREFIKRHYSVAAMTDVCENEYLSLIGSGKKNVVICGYYGYGNIGDEVMLRTLIASLRKNPDIGRIFVMHSGEFKNAERFGVETVPRFDMLRLKKTFDMCDAMIFGGGNILQDKTSTKSLIYYTQIIALAAKHGCKVVLCANGIGPITQIKNMPLVRSALESADYISMRDAESYALATELVCRRDIAETGDLAFASDIQALEDTELSKKLSGKKYYAVFPKKMRGMSKDKLTAYLRVIKRKYGLIPVLMAMHKREDAEYCIAIASRLPWAVYADVKNLSDIRAVLSGAEFSFCMRLHAVEFSVMDKCPVVAMSDDCKMASFFSSADMGECVYLPPECENADFFEALNDVIKNREEISEHLGKEAGRQREKALAELGRVNRFLSENGRDI